VTEQTDQFQKCGKNLAPKYEFKKIKKSDLNKKSLIFDFLKIMIFFQPCK